MSIYVTRWILRFPRHGDVHAGCGWIDVYGQAVPEHCGPVAPGGADPYDFLPEFASSVHSGIRALVVVRQDSPKDGQRYRDPLLVLSAREYLSTSFDVLHERICDALRGHRPRWVAESILHDGTVRVTFEDGSTMLAPGEPAE
ncbi:hypothetical protein WME73_22900 [Sorangium sp. So ce302]|uniref:hypothetical protein n=1 Tax=unclassified Sorangium TaxID=2621164 RepID=UPI003F5E9973